MSTVYDVRKRLSSLQWWLLPLLGILICFQMTTVARAAVQIPASPTNLESDAGRMISYRQQEHMWQTGDGAIHVLINLGAQTQSGNSLTLFSSFDSGETWIPSVSLTPTKQYATSDGVLVGNDLHVVYSSSAGNVMYSVLQYDSTLKSWSLVQTETAFESGKFRGLNPGIAIDNEGGVWCAFVSENYLAQEYNIRMLYRPAGDAAWQDTGLIFGQTDGDSIERSARPVAVRNGIGMVYTVHQQFFWAYRSDGAPVTEPWTEQTLFTSSPPYDTDPYASHFSVATDSEKNVHLAFSDHGQLLYARFLDASQGWDPIRTLTGDVSAGYVQVSVAAGNIVLFTNEYTYVGVFQSSDGGTSFAYTQLLTHALASADGTISYRYPRIETPGQSLDPIPLLQQYVDNNVQRALYFAVGTVP